MTDSRARQRRWYIVVFVAVSAVLAFLANIDGSLSLGERIFGAGSNKATSPPIDHGATSTSSPSSSERLTTPPVPTNASTPVKHPGAVLINLSIESTYLRGKDKASSCSVIQSFCLAIDNTVFTDVGEIRSGCHLSWELYRSGTLHLFEKGRIQYCGTDTIFLGRSPMAAGVYRLEVHVELDDGTTGLTVYRFSLID